MKALIYDQFETMPVIRDLPEPLLEPHAALIQVRATGMCMSDWHGWLGRDSDIALPHVPGHEFSGIVVATGVEVKRWSPGMRVTAPFVNACGSCPQCVSGNQQVCDHQTQPGFTHWGSFAEYVIVDHADFNLVRLPEEISFEAAASLGCRFATSFRAVVDQGRLHSGEWVVIFGCGGVGLSAIMIASAVGANVIGVDIDPEKLDFARKIGAMEVLNAGRVADVAVAVREISRGGAHLAIDALGSAGTAFNSIASLRKRGKHVQIGLMRPEERRSPIPFDQVVAKELEILGSHGMQAYRYPALLEMIQTNKLQPERLIGRSISLEEAVQEFDISASFKGTGVTIINRF
jgi:alcohol dehydrogenase